MSQERRIDFRARVEGMSGKGFAFMDILGIQTGPHTERCAVNLSTEMSTSSASAKGCGASQEMAAEP